MYFSNKQLIRWWQIRPCFDSLNFLTYFLQVSADSFWSCTGLSKTSPEAGPAIWLAPSVVSILDDNDDDDDIDENNDEAGPAIWIAPSVVSILDPFLLSLNTCSLILINCANCLIPAVSLKLFYLDWLSCFVAGHELLCLWSSRSLFQWNEGYCWSQSCLPYLEFMFWQ